MPQPIPILHTEISAEQRSLARARLPSMIAVDEADWLRQDEVWGAQLAEKARLIADRREAVIASLPGSEAAQGELLDLVLDWLIGQGGFAVRGNVVTRPDGGAVAIDRSDPLVTLSQLAQEDFCLLERRGAEHVLVAALLAFPSGWTLAEKIGRPMMALHGPARDYDQSVGARVQRMFDNLPAGRILGRANLYGEDTADLYMPRLEAEPKPDRGAAPFERSEWQTVRRLPRTGAIAFTIHVSVARA